MLFVSKVNSQNDMCCKITRKVESVSVSGRRIRREKREMKTGRII